MGPCVCVCAAVAVDAGGGEGGRRGGKRLRRGNISRYSGPRKAAPSGMLRIGGCARDARRLVATHRLLSIKTDCVSTCGPMIKCDQ